MREALARMDDACVVREHPRVRRREKSGLLAFLAAAVGPLWRSPARILGFATLLCVSAAILINALALQAQRHPAPLFKPATSPRAIPVVERRADSKTEPAKDRIGDLIREQAILPPVRPTGLGSAQDDGRLQAGVGAKQGDPIAELIRGGDQRSDPSRLIMAAQRALTKLSYGPLKVDGVMGAETRAAVERFEKDKGLPVTGELGPRVAKALSAAARVAVE